MRKMLKKLNVRIVIGIITCVCVLFMSYEIPVHASGCEDGGQHVDSDKDCSCDKCGAAIHAYEIKTYVPTTISGVVTSGDSSNTTFSAVNKETFSSGTVRLKQWGNVNTGNTNYRYNITVPKEGDYAVTASVVGSGNIKANVKLDSSIDITEEQIIHFRKGYHMIDASIDVTSFPKGGAVEVMVKITAMTQEVCANCETVKEGTGDKEEEGGEEESSDTEETGGHVDSDKDCVCDKCGESMHIYETKSYVPTTISGVVTSGDSSNTTFSAVNKETYSSGTIRLKQWGNTNTSNTKYRYNIIVPEEGDYVVTASAEGNGNKKVSVTLDASIDITEAQIIHFRKGYHMIDTSIDVTSFPKGGSVVVNIKIAALTQTKCANCGMIRE